MNHSGPPEAVAAGLGIFVMLFVCVIVLLSLAATAFWIWMLVDAITRCPSANNLKLIWILVIVLAHFIGAVIYFFVQRPKNPVQAPPPSTSPPT